MSFQPPPTSIVWAVERAAPGFWNQFLTAANQALSSSPRDVVVTSWWRSPEANRRVRGSRDSQHLVGAALDLSSVSSFAGVAGAFRSAGFVVVTEASHVHVQAWPASVARRSGLLHSIGL